MPVARSLLDQAKLLGAIDPDEVDTVKRKPLQFIRICDSRPRHDHAAVNGQVGEHSSPNADPVPTPAEAGAVAAAVAAATIPKKPNGPLKIVAKPMHAPRQDDIAADSGTSQGSPDSCVEGKDETRNNPDRVNAKEAPPRKDNFGADSGTCPQDTGASSNEEAGTIAATNEVAVSVAPKQPPVGGLRIVAKPLPEKLDADIATRNEVPSQCQDSPQPSIPHSPDGRQKEEVHQLTYYERVWLSE